MSFGPVKPVKIKPKDLRRDIERLKKFQHEKFRAQRLITEARARGYKVEIKSLGDSFSTKELSRYINELESLLFGSKNIETKGDVSCQDTQEDFQNARKFLKQAKRLKIPNLPDEPPKKNIKKFNENLCDLIQEEMKRRREEACKVFRQIKENEFFV